MSPAAIPALKLAISGPGGRQSAAETQRERRSLAIGKTTSGRSVLVAFTMREKGGKRLIRPISARYMHREEVRHHEEEAPDF